MRLKSYITETTISTEKEAKKIVKHLLPAFKKKDYGAIISELNKKGRDYGIAFGNPFRYTKDDLRKMGYDPVPYIEGAKIDKQTGVITIRIFENEYDTKRIKRELISSISHELIHRIQFSKFIPKAKDHKNIKSYLSDPREMEAWAHSIYLGIKAGDPEHLYDILEHIGDDKKLFNRLMKKIHFYMKDDKSLQNKLKMYLEDWRENYSE